MSRLCTSWDGVMVGIAAAVFVLAPVWLIARAAAMAIILLATDPHREGADSKVLPLRRRTARRDQRPDPRYNPKQFRSPK